MRISQLLPLLAVVVAVAAPADGAQPEDARQPAARKLAAARAYNAYCADCHGGQGAGNGGRASLLRLAMPDFTTPTAVVEFSRERMLAGVPARHAADVRQTWEGKLAPQAMEDVVAFMREAFMLPAPTEDASSGRAIYARTCSVCHGDRGNGASWAKNSLNPSPRDFTAEKSRELSRRHMINTVTYGSPGTAMKGFAIQLSREEIAAVVDYIRATFVFPQGLPDNDGVPGSENKGKDRHAAHGHASGPADMSLPMPRGLVPDLAWGKTFFDDNCATCHGKLGDGQGPRAYFINPKPANFTSPESRIEYNRPALFQRISDGSLGSEMPAWSKVLTEQEIANVAEYVFVSFILPPSTEQPPAAPNWEQKKN